MLAGSSWTQTISRASGCAVDGGLEFRLGPGVELLEEDDGDRRVLALRALDTELVADFAGADEHAAGFCDFGVRHDVEEARREKSASGESASGWRSMLLGVKTMSGLRHLRSAWRRSRWKYCAAVEGWQICMLSCGGELEVALDAGAGVLRALAFVAVRQQHHEAAEQPHLASPAAMNWSMMICAPLAKSPNWASQRTRLRGSRGRNRTRSRGRRPRRAWSCRPEAGLVGRRCGRAGCNGSRSRCR